MKQTYLITILFILSLTACQIVPPKPISKEIKWEAEEEVVVDAKSSNIEEANTEKNPIETPTATEEAKKTPTKTPAPKDVKPSIRYNGATVYVTKSGKKFHREDCSALSKSKIPMLFEEASAKNYTPCGLCKP
jgi:cell division septation protein DedD